MADEKQIPPVKHIPLYQAIARTFNAHNNCIKTGNTAWEHRHHLCVEKLVEDHLPSGSGIDSGVQFSFEISKDNRLVFHSSYHHMDEWGGYDGWTDFSIIVTPDLCFDFNLRITGRFPRKYQDTRDYLHEIFHFSFSEKVYPFLSVE